MGSVQTLEEATELRSRSVALILLAEAQGHDGRLLVDPEGIEALRGALRAGRASAALARLDGVAPSDLEVEELAGLWVRWFDLGRVAPYEGSNVASNAGGVTPRLADVAGFYRALGMAVVDERPDHVLAQLEFMAVAVLAEAEAIESGSTEDEKSTARCARSFLRDHLGSWIDTWAARVGGVEELSPWFPFAAAAADLVRAEAARHNVIPLVDDAILPADAGVADDEENELWCDGTGP